MTRDDALAVAACWPDDQPGCPAWMDAAGRRCGKPATDGHLCARHHKVALRRAATAVAAEQRAAGRAAQRRTQREPAVRARLARVEAELDRLDPLRRPGTPDPAMVNLPLRTRMPSASRVQHLAELHRERAQLLREVDDRG